MANKIIIKAKPLKGEDGFKTFSIRIKEDTVLKIDNLAKQSGRSRNELIGLFLEYAVQNCKIVSDNTKAKGTV